MPALMIGAMTGNEYEVQQTSVAPGSALYLFSDGVFEIVTKNQERWTLSDFLPLLLDAPLPRTSESDRLYQAVTNHAGSELLEDDFSMMVVTFQ